MDTERIAENLNRVVESVRNAERKAGRKEGSVKLLAVSKFHPAEAVIAAIGAGQSAFGENRVQEAYEKFNKIYEDFPSAELHIIGTLQKNKAARAVRIASCIESVDRLGIIEELEKQCAKIDKSIDILLEYHTGEASKAGFLSYENMYEALRYCAEGNAPHIVPKGFMTMAPFTDDEIAVRKSFVSLRDASEKLQKEFPSFDLTTLSMGMSADYKIAIEEGSTEVRIGTAIFGERETAAL